MKIKNYIPKLFINNKKAYSTGFTWVFGIVSLFGIGLLYIVFNQVFIAYLVPTIKMQVNSTYNNIDLDSQHEINSNIDKYMVYFHTLPYVLFFIVVIYMLLAAIRKEKEGETL